eukprot:10968633-Alexandrium_andersonii.AAC.1
MTSAVELANQVRACSTRWSISRPELGWTTTTRHAWGGPWSGSPTAAASTTRSGRRGPPRSRTSAS